MEFEVGDMVMLKVSHWKGVIRFGKRGKLNPRYVGPFKVLAKVGKVTYRLELPQELSSPPNHPINGESSHMCPAPLNEPLVPLPLEGIHIADEPLVMPLEGIHVDDKLQFVEEPVEIMEREIKRLKRSRIPLVKHTLMVVVGEDGDGDDDKVMVVITAVVLWWWRGGEGCGGGVAAGVIMLSGSMVAEAWMA
ncbi:hypothetical protein Tco_0916698 [Tanacetum coccineum]